ncbi:hypothetical protein [Borreliella valaisiana]|uniref:Outer membrane protein n=1 Tax=Borreliella valaisiana VS116 TaxID=445987 RepID=D6RXN6_BORVA|nr:hypothetical protein [Borreliella valaisiana]EEF81583.1 conserved hypothetical protein [Borreliella valaisiana VS116]WKC76118.1 hypothetical protein QIA33_02475 [Borreliella valaisiana]WKC77037.1 hypothetical protein QIA32_02500 [Borreliella valaisiana]WVN14125.1 hypothetical protein KJD09_01980 [Borreliella valaisiana]
MHFLKFLFSYLFLLYSNVSIIKDEVTETSVHRIIDWDRKVICFDIVKEINENEFRPVGLNTASKLISTINDFKDTLIRESLFKIIMDSENTFKNYFDLNPSLILKFSGPNSILKRSYIKYSEDLRSLTVRYELSLFPDFINLFFSHEKPYKAFYPLVNSDVDKTDYTGIVIYVGEVYNDAFGSKKLEDSFFIKIYDENIRPYFDKRMVSSEALKKWGMLEYSNDVLYNNKNRVGYRPLKLVAKSIYGKNNTDIILDEYSINKLFSNSNNIKLLQDGKLVVIK